LLLLELDGGALVAITLWPNINGSLSRHGAAAKSTQLWPTGDSNNKTSRFVAKITVLPALRQ
jgi:hypothetical protein